MRKVNMLSAKEVETAKPQKRAYKLIDGEGLYLYVTPAVASEPQKPTTTCDALYVTPAVASYGG